MSARRSASLKAIAAFGAISLNGYTIGAGGGTYLFAESAALTLTVLKEFKEQQEAAEAPTAATVKAARERGLPTRGKIRYVPPKNWHSSEPLPRGPQGGYIDRFGNEWVRDPIKGEWDVQLGRNATSGLRNFSKSGEHVNVSPKGEITH
jgi:filamentous hemagglutinin